MENGESSYRRFLDGDESAFAEIMDTYRLGLIFFINRYLHNVNDAEDVAVDVFTELLLHPHRYHFGVSLKTYLYMLGRSRALNHLRRTRRVETAPLSAAETLHAVEGSPEALLLRSERQRAVNAALEQLPEEMQLAVHLVYFDELSYREAAAVMKKRPKQVDNLLYRAKAELRTVLEKEKELWS